MVLVVVEVTYPGPVIRPPGGGGSGAPTGLTTGKYEMVTNSGGSGGGKLVLEHLVEVVVLGGMATLETGGDNSVGMVVLQVALDPVEVGIYQKLVEHLQVLVVVMPHGDGKLSSHAFITMLEQMAFVYLDWWWWCWWWWWWWFLEEVLGASGNLNAPGQGVVVLVEDGPTPLC